MLDADVLKAMEEAVHEVLLWVGFGTLVGLSAKAIMPGRDPGGALVTLMIGIGGSVIGCGIAMFAFDVEKLSPISFLGFIAATAGAFVLLFFYRLMAGSIVAEGEDPDLIELPQRSRRRRRRRRAA